VVGCITSCHKTALCIVPPSALNVLGAEINTDREFSGDGRRYEQEVSTTDRALV
jgi:hypothetical protein